MSIATDNRAETRQRSASDTSPVSLNRSRELPTLWNVDHGFNKVRDFHLASGQIIDVALKYSFYHKQESEVLAWQKPITIVHPALTGTSKMFAHHEEELGDGQLSTGWGDHLLISNKFYLEKTSVLVVEPVACNSNSQDEDFPCSADELHKKYGKLDLRPEDTVNLVNWLLVDRAVSSAKIVGFSLGGSFIPAWLEQEQTKIKKIYSVFSGFNIPDFAREYWQIQTDLLPVDTHRLPDLLGISCRLLANFGLERRNPADSCFDQVVVRLADDIESLETIDQIEGRETYMQEALKICRKIAFLRFQTREKFNKNEFESSLRYLDEQGNAFVKGMTARNYVSLVNNILALPEDPEVRPAQNSLLYSISCSDDMLYLQGEASLPGLELENEITIPCENGHDTFLNPTKGNFVNWLQHL